MRHPKRSASEQGFYEGVINITVLGAGSEFHPAANASEGHDASAHRIIVVLDRT